MGELIATFLTGTDKVNKQRKKEYPCVLPLSMEEYDGLIDYVADKWPQVNLWMQEECEGKILVIWGFYNIWFELEADAMAFKLRWL